MTSFIAHTTMDCKNAYEHSEWWKRVLGYVDLDGVSGRVIVPPSPLFTMKSL